MSSTFALRPRPTRRIACAATVAAAAAAAVLLSGCAAPTAQPDGSGSGDPQRVAEIEGTWGDDSAPGSPYLDLDDDGTLTGTDGCNRLTGEWTGSGDVIEFGPIASTRMACVDVDDWLSGARTATVSGTTMTVLGADGAEIGVLERAADDDVDPEVDDETLGSWGSSDATQPHLVISADGRVTGNDGCNALTGGWTPGDDGIRFDGVASTAKACPGIDTTLGRLASAEVDDGVLIVRDESGVELARLDRAD